MNDILGSPFFYTGLTLLCHILSIYIYKKTKTSLYPADSDFNGSANSSAKNKRNRI